MLSIITVTVIAVTIVITSFISGILGMAGGMILMGVLLALLPLPKAMMLHGVAQMAANGWRAWLWRHDVNWRVFRGTAAGALIILVLFSFIQLSASKPVAYLLLGATPFISFFLPGDLKFNVDKRGHALLCGLSCSAVQLVAGVSGPLLDVFFIYSFKHASQTSCGHQSEYPKLWPYIKNYLFRPATQYGLWQDRMVDDTGRRTAGHARHQPFTQSPGSHVGRQLSQMDTRYCNDRR